MSTLPTTSTLRKREGFLAKPDNHIVEEDYFLQLWKRKLKKKRSNQASARAALYRERLGSWDGHVEVNAVFREPSTGEMSVGQLAWKDSGDVTTHPWKLLKERCPQKLLKHCEKLWREAEGVKGTSQLTKHAIRAIAEVDRTKQATE